VQHPLSRLCSDDTASDVINPYAARLQQQRPVRTTEFLVSRLQSVQNAAARVVCNLHLNVHVTGALNCLHWLQVPHRIRFKVAMLLCHSLQGHRRCTVGPSIRRRRSWHASSNLRSVSHLQLVVLVAVSPAWATALYRLWAPLSG
jgi:hypothetical protein